MKKLIVASFAFMLASFVPASADKGINIGVSAHTGLYYGDAKETIGSAPKDREDALAVMSYGSIYIEKTFGDRFKVVLDFVPMGFESETAEDSKTDKLTSGTSTVTNKVQVDFEDMTTIYAAVNVTENMYVKGGFVTVDAITNENLGTGGSYGNAEIEGTVLAVGYNKEMDNGFFFTAEGGHQSFDAVTLNDSTNSKKIEVTDINGVVCTMSLGRSF